MGVGLPKARRCRGVCGPPGLFGTRQVLRVVQHFPPSAGLKVAGLTADGIPVNPTSACSCSQTAAYEATIASRANDQQRLEGAAALRLIDAAAGLAAEGGGRRPLPPDATISIRA